MFEECDCFVHNITCSLEEFNALPDTTELIIIGHGCMLHDKEVSFSRFQNLVTLDVGAYSLMSVEDVVISSNRIQFVFS